MDQQQDGLDQNEYQQNNYETYLKKVLKKVQTQLSTLPIQIRQLISNVNNLNETKMFDSFVFPISKAIPKQICAKVIKSNEIVVQCYQCKVDNTCVICFDCFKNGNHKDHKYIVKNAFGGCCDCGDKQAWRPSGFCSNHSGQFKQFQISKTTLNKCQQNIHGLLFVYFYLILSKNEDSERFGICLINHLIKLNTQSVYYNKITTICFSNRLKYKLNDYLDSCSILENILNFSISGNLIKKWLDLFMIMFAYYPFKLQLIKVYIEKYGTILNGSAQSFSSAGSISCQLLTSYEVVQKYCQKYKTGIGQNTISDSLLDVDDLKNFQRYYMRMLYDVGYIRKLSGKAPLLYWSMHIANNEGILNLFEYYEKISNFTTKLQIQQNLSIQNILVGIVQLSNIQNEMIQVFIGIMEIIKQNKELLNKIIVVLWNKCKLYSDSHESAIIFRPYQRCFGISLFTYFDGDLQNVKQKKTHLIKQILKISEFKFNLICSKIMNQMFETYLLYPKISNLSGLSQSLYPYSYYYRLKFHLLFSTDIVTLKILILMNNSKLTLNLLPSDLEQKSDTNTQKYQQLRLTLNSKLQFIKYLYTFKICESHLSYEIGLKVPKLDIQIADFLQRYFNSEKGSVTIQKMNCIIKKVFSEKVSFINQWIKANCIIHKQKKIIQMHPQISKQASLNKDDLWESTLNQSFSFCDPFKSKQLITEYNKQIFQMFWHKLNFQKLTQVFSKLYTQQSSEGVQLILSKILTPFLLNEQRTSSEKLIQKVLTPFLAKIPNHIIQMLVTYNKLKSDSSTAQKQQFNIQNNKKQMAAELRLKKMQKIKQQQKRFLQNAKIMQQPIQIPHRESDNSDLMVRQKQTNEACCICRNQNSQDFVYLVKIEERNFQNLLKLGYGVNSISFNSCFHKFDKKCINQQKGQFHQRYMYKCPLCKIYAQMVLPVNCIDMKYEDARDLEHYIFKIALDLLPDQNLQSIQQYLIRSIYNYILFCFADSHNYFNKRIEIYQNLIKLSIKNIKINEIEQLKSTAIKNFAKQVENKISEKIEDERLKKKQQEKQKNNKIKKQQQNQKHKQNSRKPLKIQKQFIQNFDESKEFATLMNQCQIQNTQQLINNEISLFKQFLHEFFKLLKNQLQQQAKSQIENKQMNEQQNNQFKQVLMSEQMVNHNDNINQFMKICIRKLFSKPISTSQLEFIKNMPKNKFEIVTNDLPEIYSNIKNKKCHECEQIGAKVAMCLLCSWVGCQNCERGKISRHSRLHGGINVYMDLRTSRAFYYCSQGVNAIYKLYENDWGHQIDKSSNWQQFILNKNRVHQIQKQLLLDKPINFIKKD